MAKRKYTLADAMETIARSLRTFGYPDITGEMIREVWDAWVEGKPLPHGVIGMFAEREFKEHGSVLRRLS